MYNLSNIVERWTGFRYGSNVNEGENNMKATITNNTDGTAGLFGPGGDLIKTYSRARDARRGATRLGYVVR